MTGSVNDKYESFRGFKGYVHPVEFQGERYVNFLVTKILDDGALHLNASQILDTSRRTNNGLLFLSDLPYHYRYHIAQLSGDIALSLLQKLQELPKDSPYTELHSVIDAERILLIKFLEKHLRGENILGSEDIPGEVLPDLEKVNRFLAK